MVSHRVENKAECPKEQTKQLGSQLSNTPYSADSPKRHETVMKRPSEQSEFYWYDSVEVRLIDESRESKPPSRRRGVIVVELEV